MNDNPTWQVAHLDDIDRRDRDIPVREHLGIQSFGINAYTPGEDATLINEHDEAGSRQEELYIVLDGKATFEIDGEAVDAPAGTFVFVGPESRRKATGDGSSLSAPHPARRTRGSTGVRRGRSTASRWRHTASSATPTRSKRSAVPSSACRTTRSGALRSKR